MYYYMSETFLGIFGHAATDVILKVDELPGANTSVPVSSRKVRYGGTGANIAKAAGDMGVSTALISLVGDDFPCEFKEVLRDSGVDVTYLMEVEGEKTPTCWIVTDRRERQMAFIHQGAMGTDLDISGVIQGKFQRLHIGTGPPARYEMAVRHAFKTSVPVGFDPSQELKYVYRPETFLRFLRMSDIFFCNQGEFEIALEYIGGNSPDDLLEHVKTVVRTLGRDGSILYTRDGMTKIPPFTPKRTVDPTGAGDAYRAGFYAGLFRGLGMEECCRAGSSRASFALEYHGPQEGRVTWDDVLTRMKGN